MSSQPPPPFPVLERQETEFSKSDLASLTTATTIDNEKGYVAHVDHVQVPQTILESDEDEDGNVGVAAFEASKQVAEITPAENRAIVRKLDLWLLPLFLITQTIQYLDKTALNYAKVFGMEKAMHLKGQQFNMAASMFYIGYLVATPAFSYLIGRFPAGKVLGISTVIWGVSVFTMIANKNYAHILVNRFFLGGLEAAVTPGLSLMTGWFWTRSEAPLRQTIWYSSVGIGGMIGSLMAAGISQMSDSPVARWKVIFYILGSITVCWGFVLYFFLADGPSNAKWLTKEQRVLAVARVATGGTGIKSTKFDWHQAVEALCDPKAWFLTLAMFGSSVPNGILTNFSGPIIKGLGFSTLNAALLDCAGRSLQIISLLIAGYCATRFKNSRVLCCTAGNVICVLGGALMSFLPFNKSTTWIRLVGFWLINTQSIGFTLGLVMVGSNTGGYSKKTTTSTMIFVAYCVGNILGPQFIYESEAPRYQSGSYAILGSYSGKLIAHAALGLYMWRENKRRDRVYGPADEKKAAEAGMHGVTDKKNKDFRYVL